MAILKQFFISNPQILVIELCCRLVEQRKSSFAQS